MKLNCKQWDVTKLNENEIFLYFSLKLHNLVQQPIMDTPSNFASENNQLSHMKTILESVGLGFIKEEIIEYQLPCKNESPWPEDKELIQNSIFHFESSRLKEETECKIEPNIVCKYEKDSSEEKDESLDTEQKFLSDSDFKTQDFCEQKYFNTNSSDSKHHQDFLKLENSFGSTGIMKFKNHTESEYEALACGSRGFKEDYDETTVSSVENLPISKKKIEFKKRWLI